MIDMSTWDVSSVTNMKDMFRNATSFNFALFGILPMLRLVLPIWRICLEEPHHSMLILEVGIPQVLPT